MDSYTKIEQHPDFFSKMLVSIQLEAKTIFFSRKWLIYLFMVLIPLFFQLFSSDPLGGNSPEEALISDIVLGIQLLFFSFGCLFLALPISSDEITDNVIDLYLIRPIPRYMLYFARWIVLMVSLIILNTLISLIYYLYFQLLDPSSTGISGLIDSVNLIFQILIFYSLASLVYGSLFLFVGFLGRRGLTIGTILAIFELFFVRLLFLRDNANMPATNLQVIADELFGKLYTYNVPTNVVLPDLTTSLLYVIITTILFIAAGMYYFRRKQIN